MEFRKKWSNFNKLYDESFQIGAIFHVPFYCPKSDHKRVECKLLFLSSEAENRLLTFWLGLQLRSVKSQKNQRTLKFRLWRDYSFGCFYFDDSRQSSKRAQRKKVESLRRQRCSIMQSPFEEYNTKVSQNLGGIHFYLRVERNKTEGLVFKIFTAAGSYIASSFPSWNSEFL